MIDIHEAAMGQIDCALWCVEADYGDIGLSEAVELEMTGDLADFIEGNLADLLASGLSAAQIGHDFWLTRNGHGAGFWDRGLGEVGNRLSAACKPFGGMDLWIGTSGVVYA